ncbi:MAG TPA: hypothetical protein PK854_09605 [Oscillospiraceae bacterium]|nr:hypothetical protein [Oscillospiraceae bacterium]HPS35507.1 hypothetical protein [Oscillospiraceae bacterium]
MIGGCANPGVASDKKGLYDYRALYAYHSDAPAKETLEVIGQYLQAKDTLELNGVRFEVGPDGVHEDSVQFDYALQLTPNNPKYTVNLQAVMQDVILIFALFPKINSVNIEFTQADYGFGGAISREEATEVFGQDITAFSKSKNNFAEALPPLLEAVEYHPDVMDTVDYYHAMGLDEAGN